MRNKPVGKIVAIIAALAFAAPLAVMAQTTVFNDTFTSGNDTVQIAPTAPTANSTSFEYFQQGATPTSPVLSTGDLRLRGRTTTSSISEVQALFTTSPVALMTVGDWIDLTITFNDTINIMPATYASTLNVGLFNSGGSSPVPGVRLDASGSGTGGAVGWLGYVGRGSGTNNATGVIFTRPAQGTGITNPNQSQDALFNGASGSSTFNNPTGTTVGSTPANLSAGLTTGATYTLELQIMLSAAGTLTISNALYTGGSINPANIIFSDIGTASGTTFLTNSFDALALGWRYNATSGANGIDLSSITVTDQIQPVPEPTALAVLGGGALLAVFIRRRRSGN